MLNRIFSKIRENGFCWLLRRIQWEIRCPSNPFLKSGIDTFLGMLSGLLKKLRKVKEDGLLYVIYDRNINSISFNILEFLINAEYETKRKNKTGFVVVVVPEDGTKLEWKEYSSVVDATSVEWRFQNIVTPAMFLSKYCKGFHILPNRSDVHSFVRERDIYPPLYDGFNLRRLDPKEFYRKLDRPGMFEGLSAPKQGKRYIQEWVTANKIKDPIVTITLRNYGFDKVRNSNIEAWLKLANYLLSAGYFPVVVPDTNAAFDMEHQFEGIKVFRECAWNLGLRMSLYESSFLNLFSPGGCAALVAFNPKCSYIIMDHQAKGSIINTKEALENIGLSVGSSYKFALPNQRISYKAETFENIRYEFEQFLKDFSGAKK
jgi:hypothetical protein